MIFIRTTPFLLFILVSSICVNCQRISAIRSDDPALIDALLSSTVEDLLHSKFYMKGDIDTLYLICNQHLILKDSMSYRKVNYCNHRVFDLKSTIVRIIQNDEVFRADSLFGKINILKYYFMELDTIFIDKNQIMANISFGSLSNRISYKYYFDPSGKRIQKKEFEGVTVE